MLACIAGVLLASTIAHAELPVPVPETTPAALARIRDGNIQWAAFRLLDLAIPLLILFTGLGARLRRVCESISGHRRFWTVTLFACAYLVLAGLIALPFDFYGGYVWPHAVGWSHQTLADWLKGVGVSNAVNVIVAALLIWLPYKLIAGSPRRWWLYGTLGLLPFAFLALIALPVWVKPLTTHYKPLEDGPLKTRIETLAARCGVTNIPVLVGGNSTGVDGLGPTHRIYLQTNLASVESPDQIEFTIGHELNRQLDGPRVHRWIPVGWILAHRPSGPRRHPPVLSALGLLRTFRPGVISADRVPIDLLLACISAVFQFGRPACRTRGRPLRP